jgi:hypothetical protein
VATPQGFTCRRARPRPPENVCEQGGVAVPLKLYTLYAPPNHRDGVVHQTRQGAEKDHEHFDRKTTG